MYITTGEEEESSLTGPVTLYVYGDKEHTELTLNPSHEKGFISGSLEDFRVSFPQTSQYHYIQCRTGT